MIEQAILPENQGYVTWAEQLIFHRAALQTIRDDSRLN
jgi:hypothetical protein